MNPIMLRGVKFQISLNFYFNPKKAGGEIRIM